MINRIDRRRIDYFRPEVTQLHRLRESKPVDYVGGADHTGSAVMKPSTSVHISKVLASKAVAKMEAV